MGNFVDLSGDVVYLKRSHKKALAMKHHNQVI